MPDHFFHMGLLINHSPYGIFLKPGSGITVFLDLVQVAIPRKKIETLQPGTKAIYIPSRPYGAMLLQLIA